MAATATLSFEIKNGPDVYRVYIDGGRDEGSLVIEWDAGDSSIYFSLDVIPILIDVLRKLERGTDKPAD